jgi:hypothetical protein
MPSAPDEAKTSLSSASLVIYEMGFTAAAAIRSGENGKNEQSEGSAKSY